jgi:hypothetical protein
MVRAVAAEHGIVDAEENRFGNSRREKKEGLQLGIQSP